MSEAFGSKSERGLDEGKNLVATFAHQRECRASVSDLFNPAPESPPDFRQSYGAGSSIPVMKE